MPGVKVYHAGTTRLKTGALVATGGRVLHIVAKGADEKDVLDRALKAAKKITIDGGCWHRFQNPSKRAERHEKSIVAVR